MNKFEIGINLRVTECLNQGMRLYMEDFATYYFEKCPDKPDSDRIEFAYFGVFDGHGGSDAARFAKAHLLTEIKKVDGFWSSDDNAVLHAIKQGFINTHKLMWNERDSWPRTASGFDSTAGTTASIAIVRNRKLYIGHVGDSAIVLGSKETRETSRDMWRAQQLTTDHKPSNPEERQRIEQCGGNLMRKAGIYRVVWRRPVHDCPRNEFESVPFLAVSRSLGDLWSFDEKSNKFHVSPEPDVQCINLDYTKHKCLILGSDGLWDMLSPDSAVEMVRICERSTELKVFTEPELPSNFFYNPSGSLVQMAMHRWTRAHLRADNITALVVMLDPPGRPMSQLRSEQRDMTFFRLGLRRAEAGAERVSVQDFLVQCDKWQNANRPATGNLNQPTRAANEEAPDSASPTAPSSPSSSSSSTLSSAASPSKMTPATACSVTQKLSGQAIVGKRQDSDRAMFSPPFKRSHNQQEQQQPATKEKLPSAGSSAKRLRRRVAGDEEQQHKKKIELKNSEAEKEEAVDEVENEEDASFYLPADTSIVEEEQKLKQTASSAIRRMTRAAAGADASAITPTMKTTTQTTTTTRTSPSATVVKVEQQSSGRVRTPALQPKKLVRGLEQQQSVGTQSAKKSRLSTASPAAAARCIRRLRRRKTLR